MKLRTLIGMVALIGVASSARAGGFLADVFIRPIGPGISEQLDQAHSAIGRPLDHAANAAAGVAAAEQLNQANLSLEKAVEAPTTGGKVQGTVSQSSHCVTPRGICDVQNSILTGTACYCDFNADTVFGRIQ
jgi:hypothetical protein